MNSKTEKLRVKVERVLYPPADSDRDWYILKTDEGTCKGKLAWRPKEFERLILSGSWTSYKGQREFQFKEALPDLPINQRDMLYYVCERTHGIGQAIAEMIWAAAGEDWRNVTEKHVKHLGRGTLLADFQQTIQEVELEAEKSQAIAFLMGKAATIKMASAAWEKWKTRTISIVQGNPYQLTELPHYGFYHVELGVRQAFGITDDDPRRIKAGILYSMEQLTGENGSTAIEWKILLDRSLKNLGDRYVDQIADLVREMFGTGDLRGFEKTHRIALGSDYRNEEIIWDFVEIPF
jgi:hypothetical protein